MLHVQLFPQNDRSAACQTRADGCFLLLYKHLCRIIGQVFVPGLIGPAIGAAVLKNAQIIVNNDGTTSFLPNRSIWAAAFAVIVLLSFLMVPVSKMIERRKTAKEAA